MFMNVTNLPTNDQQREAEHAELCRKIRRGDVNPCLASTAPPGPEWVEWGWDLTEEQRKAKREYWQARRSGRW